MTMDLITWVLLAGAGFLGGVMNTIAGGGTFITFPALVMAGLPEIAANATATVASLPGYFGGAVGFRREILAFDRAQLLRLTGWAALGAGIGSGLLLVSPDAAFRVIVPFLLFFATVAFLGGARLASWAARHHRLVSAYGAGSLVPITIYGGYFNGGLGIVLLALFSLWGMRDLHAMNGLKAWLSVAMGIVSLIVFARGGAIAWGPAWIMAIGTIAGGYAGAPLARRIPLGLLRGLIAATGLGMTAIFLIRLWP